MAHILPPPFEWRAIPAGKVSLDPGGYLEEHTTFDVLSFAIAKYPITNAQFAKFVEMGGYKQRKWWTDEGWETLRQGWEWSDKIGAWQPTGEAWNEPRYWKDTKWNGPEYPVVGVSWYEAVAFCYWLSDVFEENIMLPSEQQWQRAAQGDDERTYPWGNEWDCQCCNNSVKPCESRQTTPVRYFEGKGDSFFNVTDMAGNVWEWCLTASETGSQSLGGTDIRALRGGSWQYYYIHSFRCSFRSGYFPYLRFFHWGFRISRS